MEKMFKVKMKNIEGKMIEKEVPENLLSTYISIGWELVKDEKKVFPSREIKD